MQHPGWDFHFYFGPALSIKEIDFDDRWTGYRKYIHRLANLRFRNILYFQLGFWSPLWKQRWSAVIVLGDMYILSNWIIAMVCRWRKIPVFFWGHGFYGSENRIKHFVRKRFLSLADGHFLYGHYAKELMMVKGFAPGGLHVVYNSLDYDAHKAIRSKVLDRDFYRSVNYFVNSQLPILVFIGRLTPEKRLGKLITAVEALAIRNVLVNLVIIGDGPDAQGLKDMVAPSIAGQVYFYGACYDELQNGRLLANADLCVSPGNVGLTAIHSLSFGTPVCTHNDMRQQMPEAEAIVPGKTGIFFDLHRDDLAEAIESWIAGAYDRDEVRKVCYELIDTRYNPSVQLDVFRQVLTNIYCYQNPSDK